MKNGNLLAEEIRDENILEKITSGQNEIPQNLNPGDQVYVRVTFLDDEAPKASAKWYTLSEFTEVLPTLTGRYKIDYLVVPGRS